MKFSMDGFRSQLSGDVKELKEIVERVLEGEWYDEEELKDAMNEVICKSNVLNCVFVKDDDSFNDMSDLEVKLIGE